MIDYPWERPLGARLTGPETVEFRVWAPEARTVSVRVRGEDHRLSDAGHGIWEASARASAGDDYAFVLDDGAPLPDPATRWQPEGLRGPSRVYAPAPPRPLTTLHSLKDQVIYELHVGTFSAAGTFESAIPHLQELAELGVTAIEVMPVAEFPGARGWGYDGVYISASQSSYGGPAGFQRLIDAAHELGLAVILDVVYNHVGASGGKALEAYGPYFTEKYDTPWGKAMNYDDALCDPVREWVLQSAESWIADYGVDGLRLDAIHAIFDSSAEHVVQAVARRVHAANPAALVIAESGMNDPKVMRGRVGAVSAGLGCDAAWADDFHHALRTLVTDEREGYYAEFGHVADLAKALHRPHVHDGGYSTFRRKRFGAPADDIAPEAFVVFCQDHDQVGNRAFGDRLPAEARPLAAFCTLLSPFTPMLFMGEEYGENAPFQFFCDHIDPEIAEATRNGRRAEFAAFASFGHEIPDPQAVETFDASKLTRQGDPALAALYAQLLAARRELPAAAGAIGFDEAARWLQWQRGPFWMAANFDHQRATTLSCESLGAPVLRLAAGEGVVLDLAALTLPPLTGALVQDTSV